MSNDIRADLEHVFSDQSGSERNLEDQLGSDQEFLDPDLQDAVERNRARDNDASEASDEFDAARPQDDTSEASAAEGQASDSEPPPRSASNLPPIRWTKEEKETWEALRAVAGDDPNTQDVVQRALGILGSRNKQMEAGLTKRFQELADERRQAQEYAQRYDQIEQVLAPRRDQWARNGTNEVQALQQLLALNDQAVSNPVEFVKWFTAQRGITPEHLGIKAPPAQQYVQVIDTDGNVIDEFTRASAETQPAQQQQQANPHVRQYLQQQQQRLQALEQQLQQQQSTAAQAQQAQAVDYVTEFAAQVDDNGDPMWPLFDDVRVQMGHLIESNPNMSIEDAYHAAVHADPQLRAAAQEQQEIAMRRRIDGQRQQQTRAARTASSSLAPSGATGAATRGTLDSGGDIRDLLNSAWDASLRGDRVV